MKNDEFNSYEMKPEDIIDSDYLLTYKEHHKDLYDRLVRLDTSIIILEKMAKFNFDLFIGLKEMSFWQMVYWNFKDISIIIICGLMTDKGKNTHTLTKFKNDILKNIKPELKYSFQKKIKTTKFNERLKEMSERAENIRNQFVAHRLFRENTKQLTEDAGGLAVSELRLLFQQINKLFQTCSFGSEYGTALMDFMDTTVGGKPTQSHLDDIFDLIVKDSYFLNEPEKNDYYWESLKKYKSPEEIEILNFYRKKFGMPDV